MSSEYDPAEFVDRDFQAQKTPYGIAPAGGGPGQRAPTREEVDAELTQPLATSANLVSWPLVTAGQGSMVAV